LAPHAGQPNRSGEGGQASERRVRVLALISDRPWPPNTASRVRNAHLWPAVRRLGVEVKLLGLDQGGPAPATDPSGVELLALEREPYLARAWHAFRHSYHEWPRSKALRRRVAQLLEEWRPDVVHAEELRMAAYLPPAGAGRRPVRTMTLLNVESDLLRLTGSTAFRFARPLVEAVHLASLLRFERQAVEAADLAFAFSATDLARYRELYPAARWAVTRNGANGGEITPAPQPSEPSVLFVGSLSYAPNVHGLFWFLDRVMPLLPADLRVTVAGSRATEEVRRRLRASRVRFVDTPDDLSALYAEHALCVVPVLQGSGTRSKILEALAHERAVVTTTPGAAGLDLEDGEGLVRADAAEDFAAQIRRLAAAPLERGALARRGRAAVIERYDWPVVAAELVAAWSACVSR
jgi:glycosyltransferase involved in cell wall biosynthesis